jgi:hypothetical protein
MTPRRQGEQEQNYKKKPDSRMSIHARISDAPISWKFDLGVGVNLSSFGALASWRLDRVLFFFCLGG